MESKYKNVIYVMPGILLVAGVTVFLVLYFQSDSRGLRKKIIIDHDGGADDAMAIFMALQNEKQCNGPQLIALTTTFGNVNESQSYINTQRILNVADRRDIRIYRGSKSPFISSITSDYFFGHDGLGDLPVELYESIEAESEHAALALVRLARKHEGQLIVVAIGALTNIALAIKLDPRFLSRLAGLYVGAGHIHDEMYQEPEFNAVMDAEAYYMITNSSRSRELTIVPFSPIMRTAKIETAWRLNVLGTIPSKIMQYMNKYERISIPAQAPNWILLDPAVMAVAIKEDIAEFRPSQNSIVMCDGVRGYTTNNFTSSRPNARVLYSIDREAYKKLLLDLFSAE